MQILELELRNPHLHGRIGEGGLVGAMHVRTEGLPATGW